MIKLKLIFTWWENDIECKREEIYSISNDDIVSRNNLDGKIHSALFTQNFSEIIITRDNSVVL